VTRDHFDAAAGLSLFAGTIAVVVLVTWFFVRKLKRGVKVWHPNKGVMFCLGIGRDKLFFPTLTESERVTLKQRIAAPHEVVGDEEIDFFLKLYGQHMFWMLFFVALLWTVVIVSTALLVPVLYPNAGGAPTVGIELAAGGR